MKVRYARKPSRPKYGPPLYDADAGVLQALGADGCIRAVLHEPMACFCYRMVCFIINRDGKTRCVECDEAYLQGKGP